MSKWAALLFVLALSMLACGQVGTGAPAGEAVAARPTACPGPEPHDFGESIAETFEVSYEEVMAWFCDGSEFADILLALQTSEDSGYSVDELLEMAKTMTWEEIWKQVGILQ